MPPASPHLPRARRSTTTPGAAAAAAAAARTAGRSRSRHNERHRAAAAAAAADAADADAEAYATYADWHASQHVAGTHAFTLLGGRDGLTADVALGEQLGCGRYGSVYAASCAALVPAAASAAAPLAVKAFALCAAGGGSPLAFLAAAAPASAACAAASAASSAAAAPAVLCAREARARAALRHANLAPLLGFCAAPPMLLTHRAGPPGTLSDLLRATAAAATASSSASLDGHLPLPLGGLSWAARVSLARGVAAGLAYLHGAGVAHGNVTPDNVLLLGAGGAGQPFTPQLTDFGTRVLRAGAAAPGGAHADDAASDAGSATSAASAGSGSGGAGGTPYMYAAPECAAGGVIAAPCACDTYAFGAAILHALAHVGAGAAVGEFSSPLFRHLAAAAAAGSGSGGGHMAAGEESGQSDDAASYCCDWDPLQVHFARARAGWQPELAPRLPRALGAAVAACCAAAPPARPRMGDVRDALAGMEAEARGW
jgi:hypothetical protein